MIPCDGVHPAGAFGLQMDGVSTLEVRRDWSMHGLGRHPSAHKSVVVRKSALAEHTGTAYRE